MAPLVVGDWIVFSGQNIGTIYEVNNLVANLALFTAPGTKPAYVAAESAAFGITVPVSPDQPETRAVAFTTDPTTAIQWFAQDVDPCTGAITERNILLVQPSTVAPVGRAVFRMGKTAVAPPTRNVGFRMATGTTVTTNKLTAGQYIQPIFDYVFPEITAFGDNVPPYAFDQFPFLALGSGPYTPGNPVAPPLANPPVIGQLNPWPGAPVPAPASCAVAPPPSSTAPAPAGPNPDTVAITAASKARTRGGNFQVTVSANTNNLQATLSVSVAGANPVGPVAMTSLGGGNFNLVVSIKGTPTSVTVTSSANGKAGPVAI